MGEQAESDNVDLQDAESQDTPDEQQTDAEADSDASGETGEGTEQTAKGAAWSKEGQAIFTKVTQKLADDRKATDAKLDQLAEMIQQQTGTRPATPPKSASDSEKAGAIKHLDTLVRETPAFKEMRQAQLNTVATMPERFVQGVRPSELETITPSLRKWVAHFGVTDPATITARAKAMAYDLAAKHLTAKDEADEKAKEAKRAKLATQTPIGSSAGADGGNEELSFDQTEALLEELDIASQSGVRDPDIHL